MPDTELHSPPKRTEGLLTDKRGWFTLQLKVKVLVTQSCPTSCDPIACNCSPPASSLLGIFQGRILEWIAISFSNPAIFLTQESNPDLLHCRQILY